MHSSTAHVVKALKSYIGPITPSLPVKGRGHARVDVDRFTHEEVIRLFPHHGETYAERFRKGKTISYIKHHCISLEMWKYLEDSINKDISNTPL